jgi:TonB family protein
MMLRIVWDKLRPDRIAEKVFSLSVSCTLAFALLVVAGTIITAAGQPESRAAALAERPIDFDIPAQPLATALEAFSTVSGYQILMGDAGSGAGYSRAVKGAFPPKEALIEVISGTGLEVRFTSAKAAILIGHVSSRNVSTPAVPGADQEQLEAQLQNDVMRALCRNRATRPGDYRTALDLWVNPSGHVERAELLSSTGDPDRDKRIVAALEALHSVPPPRGLGQPTTLLLVPKASDSVGACDASLPAVQRAGAR